MSDQEQTHICEHDGCTSTLTQRFHYPFSDDTVWLCLEHLGDEGFCYGCHHFRAGTEDFDFSPIPGYCGECRDELRYEAGEYDDDYEEDMDFGWDEYPNKWYDKDVPADGEDSTHTYIGPDREDLG